MEKKKKKAPKHQQEEQVYLTDAQSAELDFEKGDDRE